MQPEYRKTIKNFELTETEAKILYSAREILMDMQDYLSSCNCPYDDDLSAVIDQAVDAVDKCNARLNVNIIVEES